MKGIDPLAFEQECQVTFGDKSLLRQAFVHRSYLNEVDGTSEPGDNERLEFLGDAVIEFIVSEMLYERFPTYKEGELTGIRSALVRRETLSEFANKLHMGDYLLLGQGEEASGGRTRPVTLCATFEAVVGAIYMDQGLPTVRAFLEPIMEAELRRVEESVLSKDAKSRLQEWSQRDLGHTPRYKKIDQDGPDHARIFTMQATIDKKPVGVGQGRSKQEAEQVAAAMALYRLGQDAPEYVADEELAAQWPMADVTVEELKKKG